ncbi:MAG: 50S ribosomal protein L4, partial [Nitrospirota bacterium]|nr:50S ribosomal protein L4 [Nitrospirota bacterium]
GGIAFGPRPRKYNTDMPRTAYRVAIQSALSSKQAAGEVVVLSGFQLPEPKTRYVAKKLAELELPGTILLVVGSDDQALGRAARNISGLTVMDASSLNVYDILRHDTLLVLESEVSKIQELWS